MKNLKQIALTVSIDMDDNQDWFETQASYCMSGSHNKGDYNFLCYIHQVLDVTKKNFGKRGGNLIAHCGNIILQDVYDINANQALSVWKYLDKSKKDYFDMLVKDFLTDISNELKEV